MKNKKQKTKRSSSAIIQGYTARPFYWKGTAKQLRLILSIKEKLTIK